MSLTNKEASIVLGMVARGDKKHDIAAYFGVNQARIKEVEEGQYGNLSVAPPQDLPPKGPIGPKAQRIRKAIELAAKALDAGDVNEAKVRIESAISIYDKNT